MTETEFRRMFPKASTSTLERNPQLSSSQPQQNDSSAIIGPAKAIRRGVMNASEREFAFILEAQKRAGDILRWEFEPITLRFASVSYTPDFCVWPPAIAVSGQLKFLEIKGPWTKGKFERAVERFRHAKTYYGDVFLFELHQRTRHGWRQIL
jgi:hypothetical protein